MSTQSDSLAMKLYERLIAHGATDDDIQLAIDTANPDIDAFAQQLVIARQRSVVIEELTSPLILGRIRDQHVKRYEPRDFFRQTNPYEDFVAIVLEAVEGYDNESLWRFIAALRNLTPEPVRWQVREELNKFSSTFANIRRGVEAARRQRSDLINQAVRLTGTEVRLSDLDKTELNGHGKNRLTDAGYSFLCEVLVMSDEQLRAIPGVGRLALQQIGELRQKHGVTLPAE